MNFDLREQEWIPCFYREPVQTEPVYLSMESVLINAHKIREVRDESPCVTASLIRLLSAVLYDCFPWARETGDDEWERLWKENQFSAETLREYFDNRLDSFDLLHAEKPFLQLASMKAPPTKKKLKLKQRQEDEVGDDAEDESARSTTNKLALELSSNNNATWFDHSFNDERKPVSPAQAARWLLAAQSFSLSGGNCAPYKIDTQTFPPPKFKAQAAPCVSGAIMWLGGDSLFETLMLNLMPGDFAEDKAVWNLSPEIFEQRVTTFEGETRKVNGPMEQFVFPCRAIRLVPEENETIREMLFSQGRRTDKSFHDPMKTYHVKKKDQSPVALQLDKNRALWRDAHALFKLQPRKENPREGRGITALYNATRECVEKPVSLHVAGLVVESSARVVLWRHDQLPVPRRLMQNQERISRLGELLQEAEDIATGTTGLRARIIALCEVLYAPNYGRKDDNSKKPPQKNLRILIDRFDTTDSYWAALGQRFDILLSRLETVDDIEAVSDWWCREVEGAARRSLEDAVDRLGSTRRDLMARRALAKISFSFFTKRTQTALKRQKEANKTKKASRKKAKEDA